MPNMESHNLTCCVWRRFEVREERIYVGVIGRVWDAAEHKWAETSLAARGGASKTPDDSG